MDIGPVSVQGNAFQTSETGPKNILFAFFPGRKDTVYKQLRASNVGLCFFLLTALLIILRKAE